MDVWRAGFAGDVKIGLPPREVFTGASRGGRWGRRGRNRLQRMDWNCTLRGGL
jgi:hypothetical protein